MIEPEQDWFGTLFSAIAGVFQVFAGFAVIAIGGPFATSFGLSMLMSGIGDVITAGVSVIEGQAIDLNQYFQSKALTYAIAITTAGIMQAASKSIVVGKDSLGNDVFLNEVSKTKMFQHALSLQVANMVVGYAAGYAAEKFVDKNDGDPEGKAEGAANWIIDAYAGKLLAIFIADSLNRETDMLSNLKYDASTAMNKCSKRFHDIPSNLGKSAFSTAAGLGGNMLGAVASGAAGGIIGIIKYSEFTDEFKSKYGPYIDVQYNSALNYLQSQSSSELLMKNIYFNIEQEKSIAIALEKEHFADNNLKDCHRINNKNFNATNFPVDIKFVKAACDKIYAEYQSYIENLRSYLKQTLYSGMKSTLQHDITAPLFNQAGYFLYNNVGDWLKELKKKVTNNNQQETNDSHENTNEQTPDGQDANKQKPIKLDAETSKEVSTAQEKPKAANSANKGGKVYDASKSSREPFAEYVDRHLEQFDRMPISEEDKKYAHDNLYKAWSGFKKLPIEEQKAFINSYPATEDPVIDNINFLKSMVNYLDKRAEQAQNYQEMREGLGRTLDREYVFGQSFDQYYVVVKGMAKATFTEGKYAFKDAAPGLYEKLADGLNSITETISSGLRKADESIESSRFAKEYGTVKEFGGVVVDGARENAPECAIDFLLFVAGEGIGGAAVSGAKTALGAAAKVGSKVGGALSKGASSSIDDISKVAVRTDAPNVPSSKAKVDIKEHGHKAVNSNAHQSSTNIAKTSSDIPSTSHYQNTFTTTNSPNNFHSKKTGEIITPSNIHQTPLKMEIESQAIHGIAKEVSSKIDDVHDSIMKKVDNLDDVNTANSVNSKEFGDKRIWR